MYSSATDQPDYWTHSKFGIRVPTGRLVNARVQRSLSRGSYEAEEASALLKILPANTRVLELGGGLGFIAAVVGRGPGFESYDLVEANERLLPYIEKTLALNDVMGVNVHSCLVTSEETARKANTADFQIAENFWSSSAHRNVEGRQTVQVPVRSFQSMIAECRPTVLICDIEGGEVDLLDGADLSGFDLVLMEIHPDVIGKAGVDTVFAAIRAQGLTYDIASQGQVIAFRR